MKTLKFTLALTLATGAAVAQTYDTIPVVRSSFTAADVLDVQLLSSKVVIKKTGSYQNRYLQVELGIKAIASACETMKQIQELPSQTSLASGLNPSDFYLRVETHWKTGCATGSFGSPAYVKYPLEFFVDQRPDSQSGQPWPPKFLANSQFRHFSFDSGMMGGYNRWKLYQLDYSDLNHVEWTYKKQYSYVQGEVINH